MALHVFVLLSTNNLIMKRLLSLLFLLSISIFANTQQMYFPPIQGDAWETITPASLNWCEEEISPLLDFLEESGTKAFLVLKDGRIVIEHYFDSFTQDSLWYWASAGKTITAFLTGMAQQESLLDINDPTSFYLGNGWTNASPEQELQITVKHQLSMTSGLDDGVSDNHCTIDTCLNYLAEPGSRWAYHNAPYTLLGEVIEAAAGMGLNQFVNQKLTLPTGMNGLYLSLGYNRVFFSNARSMARFGLLMLNNGNWDGNQIMTDQSYFDQMVNSSQSLNPAYGYLWWLNGKEQFMLPQTQFVFDGPLLPDAPPDMIVAAGKNGQLLNIVPSQGLVVVRMGNEPEAGIVGLVYNNDIWQKLNAVICNTSGQGEFSALNKPMVFPNPAYEDITIRLNGKKFGFKVYNVTGQMVYSANDCINICSIPAQALTKGVYMVKVYSTVQAISIKLIVH
jgi:CubicO group peptidase (beta-lactamase class C family)